MKKEFTERCVDLVLDRIGPVRAVLPRFEAGLEETIGKSEVPGDFYHSLKFTLNYPGHKQSAEETTLNLSDNNHVGINFLTDIGNKLKDYIVVTSNFDFKLFHECSLGKYCGKIEFKYRKPKQ